MIANIKKRVNLGASDMHVAGKKVFNVHLFSCVKEAIALMYLIAETRQYLMHGVH